jgi:hypothetical protein
VSNVGASFGVCRMSDMRRRYDDVGITARRSISVWLASVYLFSQRPAFSYGITAARGDNMYAARLPGERPDDEDAFRSGEPS